MPSLSDIFNTSFLILLGILLLCISLLFIYFENKSREQNHKINSMFSLVSSLAEETNNLRSNIGLYMMNGGNNVEQYIPNLNSSTDNHENKIITDLITVSDDENDSSDDDDDNDDESNNESNEDSDDSDDDTDDESSINQDKLNNINIDDNADNNIKILKLNLDQKMDDSSQSDNEEIDNEIEELNDDDIVSLGGMSIISGSEQIAAESILSLHNNHDIIITLHNYTQQNTDNDDHDIQILDDEEKKDKNEINNFLKEDLKSISINQNQNNLEDKINETFDYKKLPITKLRSIVSEKGLSSDTSKLKKNELLKLLGIE